MIILLIILILLGVLFVALALGATILIEPIIALLALYGIYRAIKHFVH